MTTCTAGIIAVTVLSALIIVGFVALAVRRIWRVADEVKRQIDEERAGFEGRRDRLRRGMAGPSSSFGSRPHP